MRVTYHIEGAWRVGPGALHADLIVGLTLMGVGASLCWVRRRVALELLFGPVELRLSYYW